MDHVRERRSEQIQIAIGQEKRPKTQDSLLGGHQGRGRYTKYGRPIREDVGRLVEDFSVLVRWVILVGISSGSILMFSLQPGGPQKD